MARLSLWNSGVHGNNYRTIDRWISQYFGRGGTAIYVHLYVGPYQQDYSMLNRDGTTVPAYAQTNDVSTEVTGSANTIQDVVFLENRDRKYSDAVYELRGIYSVNDLDFDLRQFGLFLQNDTLFIEFHQNDMIANLGRKLMPGDVLELPHRRDTTLDNEPPAINKFYVIEDASRAAGGYAVTWWPHIWRVKVSPMTDAQEYADLLTQQQTNPLGLADPGTIGQLLDTVGLDLAIDQAVVDLAKQHVPARYFQTQQYWMITPEAESVSFPWVFAGDGVPPNGAVPLGAGSTFPINPVQNNYYLRTDWKPATLFMWDRGAWRIQEQDFRHSDWTAASTLLMSFVNNDNVSTFNDGTIAPEKVALSQAVKPRADF